MCIYRQIDRVRHDFKFTSGRQPIDPENPRLWLQVLLPKGSVLNLWSSVFQLVTTLKGLLGIKQVVNIGEGTQHSDKTSRNSATDECQTSIV